MCCLDTDCADYVQEVCLNALPAPLGPVSVLYTEVRATRVAYFAAVFLNLSVIYVLSFGGVQLFLCSRLYTVNLYNCIRGVF